MWRRSDATTGGPIVTFGTKCPSMTSTWSQSAEGATSPTCSASMPKSADNTDGAIRSVSGATGVAARVDVRPSIRPAAAQPKRAQQRMRRNP